MEGIKIGRGKTFTAQASMLKRALAFIADILIIDFFILFPFRGAFEKIIPETGSFSKTLELLSSNPEHNASITIIVLAAAFLAILYFMILEKKIGQTVGKMVFNLYVESQTKELKYWQLFARSVFLMPVFPFVLLWVIDPMVMFFTKESQRLSEILSRTRVVEKYKI